MKFLFSSHFSRMTLHIEWKHSRMPAGPASGRIRPQKVRNVSFRPEGTFFRSLGNIPCEKQNFFLLPWKSKLFLSGWNRSGGLRDPGGCGSPQKSSLTTRVAQWFSFVSHFRPCDFWTVESPGAHRAMRVDGPGG